MGEVEAGDSGKWDDLRRTLRKNLIEFGDHWIWRMGGKSDKTMVYWLHDFQKCGSLERKHVREESEAHDLTN